MQNTFLSLLGATLLGGKNSKSRLENRTAQIGADAYRYQIHVPANRRAETRLPVVVFLHGIRERGANGFVPQTGAAGSLINHYLQKVPGIVVLPQCRAGKYWSDAAMEAMVMKSIEQTVAEFDADERRIYLVGVSMGGYGVWHFGARYPERFAALVPICGGSPLLSGDRFAPIAEKVSRTPAWVFHGAEDRVVPVSESREMVRAIQAFGGDVRYSEYPKVGHHVWLNVLKEKEFFSWLWERQN